MQSKQINKHNKIWIAAANSLECPLLGRQVLPRGPRLDGPSELLGSRLLVVSGVGDHKRNGVVHARIGVSEGHANPLPIPGELGDVGGNGGGGLEELAGCDDGDGGTEGQEGEEEGG